MKVLWASLLIASAPALIAGPALKGPGTNALQTAPVIVAEKSDQGASGTAAVVEAVAAVDADRAGDIQTAADGTRFLALRFRSGGAQAMRLHITGMRLPAGARMYVYGVRGAEAAEVAGPYTGSGPALDNDFWTEAVTGPEAVVEVQFEGEEPADLPFQVAAIAWVDPAEIAPAQTEPERHTRTSMFRGMALTHEVVDGVAVFEKDIVLGEAGELAEASAKLKGHERESIAITGSRYRWPNGTMPYVINALVPNQARITNAVAHWNTVMAGYVKMVPRTTEANYVEFMKAPSASTCSSGVGMGGYGRQTIQTGDYCSTGNMIHEIGHTFGLWHEQSREDRNTFVKIMWENISTSAKYNFNQNISNGDDIGAYDYGSVMHYPAYGFSTNGKATIETIPAGIPIGQRSGLSAGDIAGVKLLYPLQAAAPPPSGPPPAGTTSDVTIATNPSGLPVTVDGVKHTAPVTVKWTAGSVHTIAADVPAATTTRYTFQKWSDSGAQTHTVTAPSAATQIKSDYTVSYSVVAAAAPVGTVTVGPASSDQFYPANSTVKVSASAPAGYCFTGWTGLIGSTMPGTSLTVTKAYSVQAGFATGSVSPASTALTVSAAGGTIAAGVSASTGCRWYATSGTSWAVIGSPTGAGAGVFNVTVLANKTGAVRKAYLYVNGMPIVVTQAAN